MSDEWPGGHRFAFTVFDDTDWMTLGNGPPVYDVLTDLAMPVTKSVWVFDPGPSRATGGATCDDAAYLDWVLALQSRGHEIGFHNASDRSSQRSRTIAALDRFRDLFGHDPRTGADHAGNREALYGGSARLSGPRRALHRSLERTLQPARPRFSGADPSSPYFWGDVARERVRFWRRFTFSRTDLTDTGPVLYVDASKPLAPAWFDSSHAPRLDSFLARVDEEQVERLADTGGVCVIYTHFGVDFVDERGRPEPRFVAALERLRALDGWFAPVGDVLDHVARRDGIPVLERRAAARHERRWILDRVRSRSRFGPRVATHEVDR